MRHKGKYLKAVLTLTQNKIFKNELLRYELSIVGYEGINLFKY